MAKSMGKKGTICGPNIFGMSHNSSWLESYDHEKLENLGLGNGPKFV
jgi:hypothetical protein